jgi:hypothetical protein
VAHRPPAALRAFGEWPLVARALGEHARSCPPGETIPSIERSAPNPRRATRHVAFSEVPVRRGCQRDALPAGRQRALAAAAPMRQVAASTSLDEARKRSVTVTKGTRPKDCRRTGRNRQKVGTPTDIRRSSVTTQKRRRVAGSWSRSSSRTRCFPPLSRLHCAARTRSAPPLIVASARWWSPVIQRTMRAGSTSTPAPVTVPVLLPPA